MAQLAGLIASQRQFFFKNEYLILQSIFNAQQCDVLASELDRTWSKRWTRSERTTSFAKARCHARDLWRCCPKWALHLRKGLIGSLALQLWSQLQLRLLYDQLIFPLEQGDVEDAYSTFTLNQVSAFEEIAGGILICLRPCQKETWHLQLECGEESWTSKNEIELPNEKGLGIFLSPEIVVKMSLQKHAQAFSGMWSLIVFGLKTTRYVFKPKDPCRHFLSDWDYIIGESLRDETHPLLTAVSSATR